MSSPTRASRSKEYLQSNSTHTNDERKQSPLELLAQTCSSIGKDCLITSTHMAKSTRKNSSPSCSNPISKKATHSLKSKASSSSSTNDSNTSSPRIDPPLPFSHSPLAYYLSPPQHSYSTICTTRGCLQCETLRYFLTNSLHSSMHPFECQICPSRFYSNDQLTEHLQYNHQPAKPPTRTRFHPYFKASSRLSLDEQVPLFSPDLSMSSSAMNHLMRYLNTNPHLYK